MITGNIKKLQRILGICLSACLCFGTFSGSLVSNATDNASDNLSESLSEEVTSTERLSTNYTHVSESYSKADYKGSDVVIDIEESIKTGSEYLTEDSHEYAGKVADIEHGDELALSVNVPEDGLYWLSFDYLSYDESILPIELAFTVDGDFPFYEARSLSFETTWVQEESADVDRYGNEIVSLPDKLIRWESKLLGDASYRYSTPLKIELTAGEHEFGIKVKEGTLLLGNLTLTSPKATEEYTGSEKAEGSALITIEAENFTERNDSSIHAAYE